MLELAQGAGQLSRAVATLGTAEEHTSLVAGALLYSL